VAFAEIVEGRRPEADRQSVEASSTYWRCCSCSELVTDYGTGSSSHPDDQETGHGETCARHGAALSKWRNDTGWED